MLLFAIYLVYPFVLVELTANSIIFCNIQCIHIITTGKKWEEVLPHSTAVNFMKMLDNCGQQQTADAVSYVQSYCRFLFNGTSQKDKGISAALAGTHLSIEVYCFGLSAIVSKYIGRTEKNINKVFAAAAGKNWLLFFDEADGDDFVR